MPNLINYSPLSDAGNAFGALGNNLGEILLKIPQVRSQLAIELARLQQQEAYQRGHLGIMQQEVNQKGPLIDSQIGHYNAQAETEYAQKGLYDSQKNYHDKQTEKVDAQIRGAKMISDIIQKQHPQYQQPALVRDLGIGQLGVGNLMGGMQPQGTQTNTGNNMDLGALMGAFAAANPGDPENAMKGAQNAAALLASTIMSDPRVANRVIGDDPRKGYLALPSGSGALELGTQNITQAPATLPQGTVRTGPVAAGGTNAPIIARGNLPLVKDQTINLGNILPSLLSPASYQSKENLTNITDIVRGFATNQINKVQGQAPQQPGLRSFNSEAEALASGVKGEVLIKGRRAIIK